ncbi:unnamed protein product, partial [Sphacelaria rigidula]
LALVSRSLTTHPSLDGAWGGRGQGVLRLSGTYSSQHLSSVQYILLTVDECGLQNNHHTCNRYRTFFSRFRGATNHFLLHCSKQKGCFPAITRLAHLPTYVVGMAGSVRG